MNSSYKKFDLGLSFYAKSKILNIDNVFLDEATRDKDSCRIFTAYWLLKKNRADTFPLTEISDLCSSKYLNLSLAVKNITNTEYMGRPGDIQPQRNFSLRLSAKF